MSWSRSIEGVQPALAAALFLLLAAAAVAQENPACGQFKWPLAIERSWFEAAGLKGLQSGEAVDALSEGAFTVTLKPSADISFALLPEGKPKPDKSLGAILSFGVVATPGLYQVTLSDEAWIDIVQDGSYRPSLEFSGVHGCPGLRKSVRFELKQAPLILQLSGASSPLLKVAIRPVK